MGEPEVFDIAAPTLPTGTVVLEASAGTGKTWTIAALVVRHIALEGTPLDRMLLVTFGRAASQELRERVRVRLGEVVDVLERAVDGVAEDSRGDRLLELVLDGDHDALVLRRDRLRAAARNFDAATIATIHQFCQYALRSLGVAADTDPGAVLVDDLGDLVDQVADDLYLARFGASPDLPPFTPTQARALAQAVVSDPHAEVRPRLADIDPTDATTRAKVLFAHAVRTEVDLRKRRLGLLSYDDLLSRLADDLADEGPARARLRARWDLVMVDEFQDTDPVQWKVFARAFQGHATMVLIGDPKQAIYAFRGGDVNTYLAAHHRADHHATLATNHRSDDALLAPLHVVLQGAQLGAPEITVGPVQAHRTGSRLVGGHRPDPVRLRVVPRSLLVRAAPGETKGVSIGDLTELVARDLAADVRDLLASGATYDGRAVGAGDVAVLVRTRRQSQKVRAALAEVGVPAVVAGSGNVYGTDAADHWRTLLDGMAQPSRTGRVRAAALSPFFGIAPADLVDPDRSEELTELVAETLRDLARLFEQRGVAGVFQAMSARWRIAERLLGQVGGERLLTDLRHLAESLHAHASAHLLHLESLIGWLARQMEEGHRDVNDERSRRLESDAAAVQVMTVHGSKGLEFPIVYYPFAADRAGGGSPEVRRFHDGQERCLDLSGDKAIADRAAEEEDGEELRLTYVALTRACSQLVMWWFPSYKNTTRAPLHRLLFGRRPGESTVAPMPALPSDEAALVRLRDGWQAAGGPVVEVVTPPAEGRWSPPASPPEPLATRTWTRAIDHEWRRTSYTALTSVAPPEAVTSEPESTPRQDEPDGPSPASADGARPAAGTDGTGVWVASPMQDLPVGATFGSLVHAVLEHADPQAPDLEAELTRHVQEQLRNWPVALGEDGVEALVAALVAVHDTPLGPAAPGRTLRQVPRSDRWCELDFELPLDGGDRHGGDRSAESVVLRDLAPLLRAHLPEGDPVRAYADALDLLGGPGDQVLRGYLSGSLDVVLRAGERYLVVDYKTNHLGVPGEPLTTGHYAPERLDAAMAGSTYPLQALLYAVVLHRLLRWRLRDYDPERHLGGVLYLYVRGMAGSATPVDEAGRVCGVFTWTPPTALVQAVSDLLDGQAVGVA